MRIHTVLGGIGLMMMLAGCALIFHKTEEVPLPESVPSNWSTQITAADLPMTAKLLDLIDSPQLKDLVREALAANPDLKATALRLDGQSLRLKGQRSAFMPKINAQFYKGRNNGLSASDVGLSDSDYHALQVNASWELDLWGRLADQYAASGRELIASQADYKNARDALAARVIQAWLEQVANRRALAIISQRLAVLEKIESIVMDRYRDGMGSLEECATAQSDTQTALADQSAQKVVWRQSIRKLEVLIGRPPKGELLAGNVLPSVMIVPVDTPLSVLHSRPDVRAAMDRVIAARRTASAADKAMLPQLSLSGNIFRYGVKLKDLGSGTSYWELLSTVVQPLFQGGALINEARAQKTETEALAMRLKSVVLKALKEVEDALDQERELDIQHHALERAVQEAESSSRYFSERYRQGLDTIQNQLIAREKEMNLKIRLNQIVADQLSGRIDLALALGVGAGENSASSKERP